MPILAVDALLPMRLEPAKRNRGLEIWRQNTIGQAPHGHIVPVELRMSSSASFFCASLKA